jgi:putative glutamine amidotransferase
MSAPLIAIPAHPLSQRRLEPYLRALRRAGGIEAVMMREPPTDNDPASLVRRFDGLMLLGGDDVDPGMYGEEASEHVYGADPDRDQFEIALVHGAIGDGLPVLAICRGHQVLNVAFGGTLHQHITDRDDLVGHGIPAKDDGAQLHDVVVDHDARLAHALDTDRATCSSHHHQAVDRVGDGLRVVARAADGIVEGLELEDSGAPWVIGVQWHPEETADHDPVQQRLFDRFVAETGKR